ncbi:MAG: class I SAM-dependent methyltransferase [Candidatus Methanomethylophilaceae archaeon]|nr:class I SAM-dependent methyltransferase [Candidatus Methanomethylophilaceae archaeon]
MKEKVTIKRGTPQETLMLPLYGRYKANRMYPQLFKDTTAKEIIDRIDYDIEQSDMGKGPQFVYGMRQDVAERKAKEFLARNPKGILVNLGCGLDTIFDHIDNGECRMVNIDFPEVMEFRRKLFDPKDREIDIGKDANDHTWMDEIGFNPGDKVFVMSLGVLFYFEPDDVKRLVDAMGRRFPGATMVFDYENARMLAKSNKAVVKTGNKGAWMPFSMEDARKEVAAFSDTVESVDVMNEMPPEYEALPFFYKWFFKRCLRKESMTFAEVRFKEAAE